jgi:hypothetical protein
VDPSAVRNAGFPRGRADRRDGAPASSIKAVPKPAWMRVSLWCFDVCDLDLPFALQMATSQFLAVRTSSTVPS